jgi:hypothetical protein
VTHILGQNKPSLAYIAHSGVKGMRWGVRKKNRYSSNEIRSALGRIIDRSSKAHEKVVNAKTSSQYQKALKNESKVELADKTSLDRSIAMRYTLGEKVVFTLLLGPVGSHVVIRKNRRKADRMESAARSK